MDAMSIFNIDGYDIISQGTCFGNIGGLAIYISNMFDYEMTMNRNIYTHWGDLS